MKKKDQLAAWSQGFLCYPFNLQLNDMAAIAQVNVEKKNRRKCFEEMII